MVVDAWDLRPHVSPPSATSAWSSRRSGPRCPTTRSSSRVGSTATPRGRSRRPPGRRWRRWPVRHEGSAPPTLARPIDVPSPSILRCECRVHSPMRMSCAPAPPPRPRAPRGGRRSRREALAPRTRSLPPGEARAVSSPRGRRYRPQARPTGSAARRSVRPRGLDEARVSEQSAERRREHRGAVDLLDRQRLQSSRAGGLGPGRRWRPRSSSPVSTKVSTVLPPRSR